ncbi:hypothetical protein ACGFIF_31530 [Kribbella sp. NPDC049174]|uniref:hypothetical protein n=1 Tax=Kribbella sp. NPDC049174 TaxID=3364112 RepID=UPI003722E556
MTRELKNLMDRATERPDSFTPNPAALVAAGRRRVRNRRLAGSLVAALVLLFAGVTVVLDLQDLRGVDPAAQPTTAPTGPNRPQDNYKLCTASNGRVLGSEAWAWSEVLAITDDYGSVSIRRQPGEKNAAIAMYAFCVTQPEVALSVPTGGRGGVLLRKSPIDATRSMTTVFGRAYGEAMKVVVETGDGQSGEGVAKADFFVYRHIEARPWPGAMPTAVIRIYDARGRLDAVGKW